jgi:hypothetical protein
VLSPSIDVTAGSDLDEGAPAKEALGYGPGQEPEAERETVRDVPPKQSARLVHQAVQPLETKALKRSGRARLVPGD